MTKYTIWDKTNIGENYPGITSPLTYSFVRRSYQAVYKNFCLRIGVSPSEISEKYYIFENLVGHIHGQLYYNLFSWYELLSFLPGERQTSTWFDTMLDPVVRRSIHEISDRKYTFQFRIYRIYIGIRFIFLSVFFPLLRREFDRKSSVLFSSGFSANFLKMTKQELIGWFRVLEDRFLSVWAIPIINDFRLMVSYGILVHAARSWASDPDEVLRQLSTHKSVPISVIILRDSQRIAETIQNTPLYFSLFQKVDASIIWKKLSRSSYRELKRLIDLYLDQYGDRMANELKLEEPSFQENPVRFIELLKRFAKNKKIIHKDRLLFSDSSLVWWKRLLLNSLSRFVSDAMHQREFFRLRRLQAFRIAKNIYLEFARRFVSQKKLHVFQDIFFLTHDEIIDIALHPSLNGSLFSLIKKRKLIQSQYSKHVLPQLVLTDIFGNIVRQKVQSRKNVKKSGNVSGKPASAGTIEGEVVIMDSLDTKADIAGKILITKTTDPGWTILFPLLSGVITQYGGMLSHAAIIARELEIPCIVGVTRVTEMFKSGDRIFMNGATGEIRRLETV